jgi:hypothetical protein
MIMGIRRVVTGYDGTGKAVVVRVAAVRSVR